MNTEKHARDMLFKGERPVFRQATSDDMKWLWAAHKMMTDDEMSQEDFTEHVISKLEGFSRVYVAEDVNNGFNDHRGPIGLIIANYDGWNIEPHVEWFPWATARNKIKGAVGFLMFQRFQPDVGCIQIHASEKNQTFFKRLMKYLPLRVAGKVAGGRPDGADYIFYVRGKRQK